MSESLAPEAVRLAAERLRGAAHRTPVFSSRTLDARLSASVFCKGEHLQRTGSFKFRGAWNALQSLSADECRRGVITYSSGNHAAALAAAGSQLGIRVVVALPDNALPLKREAVIGYGAEIVPCSANERETVGRRVAAERGLVVIPPYDDDRIIAGQGTAALELMEEVGELDLLLAPTGGGGLLSGTALAAQVLELERGHRTQVWGVEPEIANDAQRSLRTGAIVHLEDTPMTIADGLRTRYLGERTFAVIRRHVEGIVTVSEEEIVDAVRWLWLRMKLVVEPSGAVPLAALLAGRFDLKGRRVGVILSGGNADPAALAPYFPA
ncbi:MAG: pyridoxal-phosphate dependent enzyme [Candidatus Eisenbacteria bacterium]|nr:pyridoxal-phosphate dependent enzyme [Candidatus Eisenbacteria bacterium]MCC7142685.1 pyridoxal-phosphate dependent enzyme [Candidatus Eisenbacteria bacterium]